MSECAKISADITVNCDKPIQAGTRDKMWVMNFEDWQAATITPNGTNPQIYEGISLPSGAVAYVVEGINNSILPKNAYVKGPYLGSFDHEVNFKAFSLNPTVKDELEKATKGRLVCIVENNYKGDDGEAAFEVYGPDCGLIVESLERDPSSADTQGAYDIVLKSSEKAREAHLPATIFLTDYPTSKAIVEGLE